MDTEKILKLLEFPTPTVADGLDLLGVRDPTLGYSGPDVRPLMPDMGVRLGVAVTARLDTTSAGTDRPASLFDDWLRLIRQVSGPTASPPMPVFAVIEAVGRRPVYTVTLGDVMATFMTLAGVAGYVTNGSIRDIEGVRQAGLPCWAAGVSPMHGRLRWLDLNCTVMIDGMTVRPGDIIHADVNGVLAIPPDIADKVYDEAIKVREREHAIFERWRAPGADIDAYLASRKSETERH